MNQNWLGKIANNYSSAEYTVQLLNKSNFNSPYLKKPQGFTQWLFTPLWTDNISYSKVLNNSISILVTSFEVLFEPVQIWKN